MDPGKGPRHCWTCCWPGQTWVAGSKQGVDGWWLSLGFVQLPPGCFFFSGSIFRTHVYSFLEDGWRETARFYLFGSRAEEMITASARMCNRSHHFLRNSCVQSALKRRGDGCHGDLRQTARGGKPTHTSVHSVTSLHTHAFK